MKPLFSPSCDLVGWLDPGRAIFDAGMAYVAFLANGNAWSPDAGRWLGPVAGATVQDRSGRPVAWNPDEPPASSSPLPPAPPVIPKRPLAPKRPLRPKRPLFPRTPLGGWSPLSFDEWLKG